MAIQQGYLIEIPHSRQRGCAVDKSVEESTSRSGLDRVGLAGRGKEMVSTLSGGEKQRVGLARAMFRKADVILADEPTASLDLGNRELVTGFLQSEARRGAAVVIATHDEQLMAACDFKLDLAVPSR